MVPFPPFLLLSSGVMVASQNATLVLSVLVGLVVPEANVSSLLRLLLLPLPPVFWGLVFLDASYLLLFRLFQANEFIATDMEDEGGWEVLSRKRKSQARAMSLDMNGSPNCISKVL